jgi:mono/diheme cytochrome c family protein
MKALISSGAAVFAVSLVYASLSAQTGPGVSEGRSAASAVAQHQGLLSQYCVTCHNQRLQTGGLTLDPAALATPATNIETWEKVTRKLRAGLMPPPGSPRPAPAVLDAFAGWLEGELDRIAARSPNPGRPMLHRLNRSEYANAIRDLLRLDVDAALLLPPDDSAFGFDNVSDVLGVSPSLQERYLTAASTISALAVGDTRMRPGGETYRVPQDLSQDQHIDGLPLGTLGGTRVRHIFPVDGEYDIQTKLYRTNLNMVRGLQYPHDVEVAIDGRTVHRATIGGNADLAAMFDKPTDTGDDVERRLRTKVKVSAGAHDVTVAFVGNMALKDAVRLQPFLRSSADNFDWAGHPHIQTVAITGPFGATSPGDTPARRAIFTCTPAGSSATATKSRRSSSSVTSEGGCARQILSRLARRAYRRSPTEAELQPLLAFYEDGRKEGSFDRGIQRGLERILASPLFIFRVEQDPPSRSELRRDPAASNVAGSIMVDAGRVYRISDTELASRLSFFLWSSIPDETLLARAERGTLQQAAALDAQITRMLADKKSGALVSNFAGQWLQLRNVRSVQPNTNLFPDFDDNLRRSMRRETELLFESVIREDRSVLDLLRADYTYLDERLARHYGVPNIYGSQFRRVAVTDDPRRGLLGHASILAVTSHAERTSPVLRGKWVLDNFLGLVVPPPPDDVPPLVAKDGEAPKTLRAQMEAHRANPVCASCHKLLDPIGFALENFDAVGSWRTKEAAGPIDASGQLADGTRVDGVVALRNAILARPDVFVTTMTEKMFVYALGRGIEAYDRPAIRQIVRDAARENYRFSSLVRGIVRSPAFRMRTKPADAAPVSSGGAP